MRHYKYLIVGGGMTGDAAVRGIREIDAKGTVGLIGSEADLPYARPPLSKGMWKGRPFEKIWRQTDKLAVDLFMGRPVTELETDGKRLRDDRGDEFSYEKLLLATGGSPNQLPFGDGHIIYFRTLRDYERLRALAESREKFVVIGGGFIGPEIAAALCMQGRKVTMVTRGNAIGGQLFPSDLARYLNEYYAGKGIELITGDVVEGLEEREDSYILKTRAGRTLQADGVVAGLGLRPNVDLARAANLRIDNGIVVDSQLRTSATDIFAAGDVAKFPEAALGTLTRVEHEDNALQMGRQAGRNMAGAGEAYTHTPYFYSDLFDLGYEAVGELSRRLETFADWTEPFQKGVIYYLKDDRVRGVLLWNVWDKRDEAAALLLEPGPFNPASLKGRIQAGK